MAEALKRAGYETFYVGKWHLGKEPFHPQHQGFDRTASVADRFPYFSNSEGKETAPEEGDSQARQIQDHPIMAAMIESMDDRPASAVRSGHHKLIEFLEDGRLELYDLSRDPGEQHNLAVEMPDRADQLRALLYEWRSSVNARMPTPNPNHIPGSILGVTRDDR